MNGDFTIKLLAFLRGWGWEILGEGVLLGFGDGGAFGVSIGEFTDLRGGFFDFFEELWWRLSGVLFPIVFFFDSCVILFGDVLVFFIEFVVSFWSVDCVIIFTLFEIVLIVLWRFVGSCSVGLIVFPLTVNCVLRVLIVDLFCLVCAGVCWGGVFGC